MTSQSSANASPIIWHDSLAHRVVANISKISAEHEDPLTRIHDQLADLQSKLIEIEQFINFPVLTSITRKQNYREVGRLDCTTAINFLQVLPDHTILASDTHGKMFILKQSSDGEWHSEVFQQSSGAIVAFQGLPNGKIVSMGADGQLHSWSKRSGDTWQRVRLDPAVNVSCFQVLPTGEIVYGGTGGRIQILDQRLNSGWQKQTLADYNHKITCLQALPNGQIVSGTNLGKVMILNRNAQGSERHEKLDVHDGKVQCLQVLSSGEIVSGGNDCTVRIQRRSPSGWQSEVLDGHDGPVQCLQALPDGRVISGDNIGRIRVWSKDREQGWNYELAGWHQERVRYVQALPCGKIVSCGWDKTIRFWDEDVVDPTQGGQK